MILEKIYNYAPVWMQKVMCTVKGWTVQRRRYAKGFFCEMERLESRKDNPEELLRKFLALAR